MPFLYLFSLYLAFMIYFHANSTNTCWCVCRCLSVCLLVGLSVGLSVSIKIEKLSTTTNRKSTKWTSKCAIEAYIVCCTKWPWSMTECASNTITWNRALDKWWFQHHFVNNTRAKSFNVYTIFMVFLVICNIMINCDCDVIPSMYM